MAYLYRINFIHIDKIACANETSNKLSKYFLFPWLFPLSQQTPLFEKGGKNHSLIKNDVKL